MNVWQIGVLFVPVQDLVERFAHGTAIIHLELRPWHGANGLLGECRAQGCEMQMAEPGGLERRLRSTGERVQSR